jgi:hypothetical protein
MNKIVLILVCIIFVTSFFTNFYPRKTLATEIFIYNDSSNIISNLNYSASNDDWISYNDGYADDAFGLTGGGIITMAIEFTDAELAPYRNYIIDKLNVAFGSENNPLGESFNYEVWIKNYLPGDPYCSCLSKVATGTSTGDIWNIIDVSDTAIPDTGNLFIGVNVEHLAGQYPCGVDQNQSGPTQAALMTYQGYDSWTDLFTQGFPGVWCLDVSIYPNNPPNTPVYLNPSNHETNVDINDSLLWTCSDPEGDFLTYNVYFGTSSNPPLVAKRALNYYTPDDMNYDTKYYWKIVVKDEFGESVTGPIWDFTTIKNPNNPPYTPSNPNPSDNAINVDININLSWTGGDPDVGDTVTYDVYFGVYEPLQKVASNISLTTYTPLLYNGLYYCWSIVAWDNHGLSTEGPWWGFTTIEPNNSPEKPTCTYDKKNMEITVYSTDTDGDQIRYGVDWNNDFNVDEWTEFVDSGIEQKVDCEDREGTIGVIAEDEFSAQSDWVTVNSKNKDIKHTILSWFFEKLIYHFPLFQKTLNQIT